jgi:hypothetical protein
MWRPETFGSPILEDLIDVDGRIKVNVYLSSLMMKVPDHVCLRLDLYMSHVLLLCVSFIFLSVLHV